jgi:myo-inositol-1(or 4)-monophosphatase
MSESALELELLDVARDAAHASAAELRPRFRRGHHQVRSKSTPTDLVSEADLAAESAIREVLARRRPTDTILGEEGGQTGDGELRWVIDPLDGTINFLFGVPQFAVSVACENADGTLVGVVLDPLRGESFSATRSGRAELNGSPITASRRDQLATALVGTGFSYDACERARQAIVLARVLPRVRDIRRAGAAALDLAWCACGRLDAFYERGLKPWDRAAGGLIAMRAGVELRVLAEVGEDSEGVLAAPAALVEELMALVLGRS